MDGLVFGAGIAQGLNFRTGMCSRINKICWSSNMSFCFTEEIEHVFTEKKSNKVSLLYCLYLTLSGVGLILKLVGTETSLYFKFW